MSALIKRCRVVICRASAFTARMFAVIYDAFVTRSFIRDAAASLRVYADILMSKSNVATQDNAIVHARCARCYAARHVSMSLSMLR